MRSVSSWSGLFSTLTRPVWSMNRRFLLWVISVWISFMAAGIDILPVSTM
jgi:hypothetical protein